MPCALAVAAYVAALRGPFLFDDLPAVVDNPSIRSLSRFGTILAGSRRPLTNLSFAVDWALWRGRPFGFHLTNVLLHAVAVLLVLLLARRLVREGAALFAASLFALHPLASETVAYVASRSGLLCAIFLVSSLLAWHAQRRPLAIAAWVLAVAARETGLMAPVLWLACDRLLIPDEARRAPRWIAAAGGLALAAGLWRLQSYLRLEGGTLELLPAQLYAQAAVIWRYLFVWLVPVGLSPVHEPPTGADSIVGLLALAIAGWLLWSSRRRAPVATFGAVWFLVLLLPSSLAPLWQPIAEHRVYESSIGAALAAGALADRALARWPARSLVPALAALTLLGFGCATVARARLWADPVALWSDATDKAPRSWLAHLELGDALRDRGDCLPALAAYRDALALRDERRARISTALCQAALGRFDEAEAALARELVLTPLDPKLHYDLGVMHEERGRLEQARAEFARAVELSPHYTRARDRLRRLEEMR